LCDRFAVEIREGLNAKTSTPVVREDAVESLFNFSAGLLRYVGAGFHIADQRRNS
jgi:hypothetical protein